jgi:hypothetical protein
MKNASKAKICYVQNLAPEVVVHALSASYPKVRLISIQAQVSPGKGTICAWEFLEH